MNSLSAALSVLGAFIAGVTGASAQRLDLAPTPLEAFAARPTATLIWSQPLGEIASPASRAVVTAVVYEDLTATPPVMRGIKISMFHLQPNVDCNLIFRSRAVLCARADAAIFYNEDNFTRVREGLARGHTEDNLIGSFRQRWKDVLVTGIDIGGYTFDGRELLDVIHLIDAAADALGSAPR